MGVNRSGDGACVGSEGDPISVDGSDKKMHLESEQVRTPGG